jgi:hypothetical protein
MGRKWTYYEIRRMFPDGSWELRSLPDEQDDFPTLREAKAALANARRNEEAGSGDHVYKITVEEV